MKPQKLIRNGSVKYIDLGDSFDQSIDNIIFPNTLHQFNQNIVKKYIDKNNKKPSRTDKNNEIKILGS